MSETISDFDKRMTEKYKISTEITAFPLSASFSPTFQNVSSHFTVFFANPSHNSQAINVSFEGSPNFSVSSPQIVISGGTVYCCVVSFISDTPGNYSGVLNARVDGGNTCCVVLEAKCYESPLSFPKEILETFVFDDLATSCPLNVKNQSINVPLHVLITSNSPAFTVNNPSLDLDCGKEEEIEVSFDATRETVTDPILSVQCIDSGDSFDIPLTVGRVRNTINVDFGNMSVGQQRTEVINVMCATQITAVQPPFAVTVMNQNDETEVSITEDSDVQVMIECRGDEAGKHEEVVEFEEFFLHIEATFFEPFYAIEDPGEGDCIILHNTSEKSENCFVSFTDDYSSRTEVKLKPGMEKEIVMNGQKNLFISWYSDNEPVFDKFVFEQSEEKIKVGKADKHIFCDTIPITLDNDSDMPKHVSLMVDNPQFNVDEFKTLVIPPHSMQSVNVSYTPTKASKETTSIRVIDEETKQEVSEMTVESALKLKSDVSFIPFFGASCDYVTNAYVAVSGSETINIYAPEWVEAPETVKQGIKCTLSCKDIPKASHVDFITFEGENAADLDIPILAYRGKSDITYTITQKLTRRGDVMTATIEVMNNGMRPGFVIFTTSDDENERQIHAAPQSAIIGASKRVFFKFEIEDGEGPVSVTMHSGDEIMRQMRAYTKPSSFYAVSFDDANIRDELGDFTDIINTANKRQIERLFKESVEMKTITFTEDNNEDDEEIEDTLLMSTMVSRNFEEPSFSVSETEVNFGCLQLGSDVSKSVWLENMTLSPIELHLECNSEFIQIPETIKLRSEEQRKLIIRIPRDVAYELDDVIVITNDMDTEEIHVVADVEEPMTQIETLDFGNCIIGRLYRGKIQITNKKSRSVTINASIDPPFYLPVDSVTIEPSRFVKFPVHFVPNHIDVFQKPLEFTVEDGPSFFVTIVGKGEY